MKEITAYQCEACKSPFTDADKAEKCNAACNRRLEKKKKDKIRQAKIKEKSDWLRLNLKSINDLDTMIAKFYKRTQGVAVSVNISRLKIQNNIATFYAKVEAIDGKSRVCMDAITRGAQWGYKTHDGVIVASGFDLDGAGSGFGHGFSAGSKLYLEQCPHIKKLIDERKKLEDKVKEYSHLRKMIRDKTEELVKSDEEYKAHVGRKDVFLEYSNLASKLAGQRANDIRNDRYPKLVKELIPEDLSDAYKKHCEISSALHIDI